MGLFDFVEDIAKEAGKVAGDVAKDAGKTVGRVIDGDLNPVEIAEKAVEEGGKVVEKFFDGLDGD